MGREAYNQSRASTTNKARKKMATRKIARINREAGDHWVGNGFPVKTLVSYDSLGNEISPFLMLDYAAPREFAPSDTQRGVDQHPHRGFETVTIVYQGEVEHKDSAGHSGRVGPGDVQWMTAARGVLHEEKHSAEFTERGGLLEMAQLWINLPAKDKMSAPRYQEIAKRDIPSVDLADGAGAVRIIAGAYAGAKGPAKTFTPLELLDIRLNAGGEIAIPIPDKFNASLLVMRGRLETSAEVISASELAVFERSGNEVILRAETDTAALFMCGEPIDEPIAGAGPFVMNTEAELRKAFEDFRAGRF
jgi:redox-sensitive bicupin YhaK (pirin superfamily)